jgi:hypothetical protein
MAFGAGIRQEDAQLAVLDTPSRAAILPLHPHRLGAFFDKAGFIDHQHSLGIPELLAHIATQDIPQAVALPAGAVQEVLHGIRCRFSHFFGQLPAIFAFDGTE